MRMSGLWKVEICGSIGRGETDGTGANCIEPARAGSLEGVARGRAEACEASGSDRYRFHWDSSRGTRSLFPFGLSASAKVSCRGPVLLNPSPPSRPGEFHPEPLTDSGLEPLDSSGSCHPLKAAAFRRDL
jgi:hypothetical protein